jgi:MoaA/NifB/PqqE/SkfB family radical SAM enzyme
MSKFRDRYPYLHQIVGTTYRSLRMYWWGRSGRSLLPLMAHVGRRAFGQSVPRFMTLAVTFRCQCRCVHCYAHGRAASKREELDTQEVKAVLDDAKRIGVLQVTFSGGDPILREDLVELVRYAHDIGLLTRISSNGVMLDRRKAAELKSAGLSLCGISIDDADPKTHSDLRGLPDAFERACAGIRNARREGIPVELLTYAAKKNVNAGLERIFALGKELGAQSVYVFFPIASGRWDKASELLLTEEEKEELRRLHSIAYAHVEVPRAEGNCCVLQKTVVYVSPYGDVTPCPFVPFVMGNVRKHDLAEMWDRFSSGMKTHCPGDCPLNEPVARQQLVDDVRAVRAAIS